MKKYFLCFLLLFIFLTGCSSDDSVVNYVQAKEKIINEGAILVDVRTSDEYDEGHIEGAVLLTLDDIDEESSANIIKSKSTPVIVYCKSGKRSAQALEILKKLGYEKVYDLGAMSNWKE